MDVNREINSLITNLESANKIYLNDNMYLLKLHNNKIFLNWLENGPNKLEFKFKEYHNPASKLYNGKTKVTGDNIVEFITIGVIKKESLKNVRFVCCAVDVGRISNVYFGDRSKQGNGTSGLVFNGSYFFLKIHIENNMYGVNRSNFEYEPIGFYKYLQFNNLQPVTTRDVAIDKSHLEPLNNKNLDLFSLNWVSDTLGILKVDKNGNFSVIKIANYDEKIHSALDPIDQVLMGNILVYDGTILMTEDKLSIVIIKKQLANIPPFTTGNICDVNGNILSGQDIMRLSSNDPIYVTANLPTVGKVIQQTTFSYDDIFMPYNFTLIQKTKGGAPGLVPPGMPAHASDINPRTCLMIDRNNNVLTIHVEGRNTYCGGQGLDLFDLAKLCSKLGAVYAINLDGGGSSKLEWKEIGVRADYAGLDDYDVSNAIVIVPREATIIGDVANEYE